MRPYSQLSALGLNRMPQDWAKSNLHAETTGSVILMRRARTFTSTRDPSLLMIDISRSTVNRPRSALRTRENIGRCNPSPGVCGTHAQTLPIEGLDNLGYEDRLALQGVRAPVPQFVRRTVLRP